MTALEEQLTRALRRLSEQYAQEQRRHSGQIEALREYVEALRQHAERQGEKNEALQQQIERLDGQVTRLAEYYGTSAAARPSGRGW